MTDKFVRIVIILLLGLILPAFAGAQDFEATLSRLRSGEPQQQRRAFLALQKLQEHSRWPELLPLLNADSPLLRRYVVTILGQWQLAAARIYLLPKLQDPDKWVRAAVVWALARSDQKVTAEIAAALGDRAWEVRCAAANTIGRMRQSGKHWAQQLLPLLQDQHWQVRYAAVCQIGKLQCLEGLERLHRMLANARENETVRAAACRSLTKIGSEQSLPLLLQAYTGVSAPVRLASDRALTQLAKSYPAWFMAKLQERTLDLALRRYILTIFGRINAGHTVPLLHKLLQDPEQAASLRAGILNLLAQLQGSAARSLFYRYLASSDAILQRGAVVALGRLGDSHALPQLFNLLGSDNVALRESTLWAITQAKRRQVVPLVLTRLTTSKDPKLLRQFIRLVATLQITEAVPHLLGLQEPTLENVVCWALEILYPQLPTDHPQRQRIMERVSKRKKILENK